MARQPIEWVAQEEQAYYCRLPRPRQRHATHHTEKRPHSTDVQLGGRWKHKPEDAGHFHTVLNDCSVPRYVYDSPNGSIIYRARIINDRDQPTRSPDYEQTVRPRRESRPHDRERRTRSPDYESIVYRPIEPYHREREDRQEHIERVNADDRRRNSRIDSFNRDIQIRPLLTLSGKYPQRFSYPKRLVDIMRISHSDLHRIMVVSGCTPKSDERDHWKGRWARTHNRHPVSIEQLKNLETLFNQLGAHYVAREMRAIRKDRHVERIWDDEFPIKRPRARTVLEY